MTQIFLLILSSPCGSPIMHVLDIPVFFFFFLDVLSHFFLFVFQFWKFLLTYPPAQKFFPHFSFIFVTVVFLSSSISFLSFLKILNCLYTLSISSYILFTFSIIAFSILSIVVLNSLSDNSNIPAIDLLQMLVLPCQTDFFFFLPFCMSCNF